MVGFVLMSPIQLSFIPYFRLLSHLFLPFTSIYFVNFVSRFPLYPFFLKYSYSFPSILTLISHHYILLVRFSPKFISLLFLSNSLSSPLLRFTSPIHPHFIPLSSPPFRLLPSRIGNLFLYFPTSPSLTGRPSALCHVRQYRKFVPASPCLHNSIPGLCFTQFSPGGVW